MTLERLLPRYTLLEGGRRIALVIPNGGLRASSSAAIVKSSKRVDCARVARNAEHALVALCLYCVFYEDCRFGASGGVVHMVQSRLNRTLRQASSVATEATCVLSHGIVLVKTLDFGFTRVQGLRHCWCSLAIPLEHLLNKEPLPRALA